MAGCQGARCDAAVPQATRAAAAQQPSLMVAVCRHRSNTHGVLGCCRCLVVLSLEADYVSLLSA